MEAFKNGDIYRSPLLLSSLFCKMQDNEMRRKYFGHLVATILSLDFVLVCFIDLVIRLDKGFSILVSKDRAVFTSENSLEEWRWEPLWSELYDNDIFIFEDKKGQMYIVADQ